MSGTLDAVSDSPNRDVTVNPDQVLAPGESEASTGEDENADYISQPAKVMRIGSMVKQLLDEARSAPLDEAGRTRLREIYETSVHELSGALSPDLGPGALARWRMPFSAEVPIGVRAAHRPGPARRLARGTLSRHPGVAVRPAGGRGRPTRKDARPLPAARARRAARRHLPLGTARWRSVAGGVTCKSHPCNSSTRRRSVRLMAEGFVHLHNHTEYSMLDGAARVEEMVLAAKADGQSAIAITDHGNLYGVIDFYEACSKHGVKPIIGLEAYMAANSRFDRPAAPGQDRRHRR